ncbi:hypothetical protein I3760_14G043700 [Carya illinoinensis]|nr:hypothetical protein I3760_14G043700 [Carya illinoinensis]
MDKTTRTIADQIVEGGDSPDNHDEMETNILPSTCADPEVLRNDNYADWSARMKNCLLGQGLWDIVETTMEPPTPEDDVIEFEAWNKNNDAALHAIQSSCGMDILSCINKISSAKIAWIMLGKMFMGSNGSQDKLILTTNDDSIIDGGKSSNSDNMGSNGSHDKLILTTNDDSIIDEGKSSNPDNPGQEREDDYADLVKAVRIGDWGATRDFLKLHPSALTTKILFTGGTVLHAAVDAEQERIVEELVNMILERDLAMQNNSGYTALHEVSIIGNYRMAEFLITKNKSLVSIRNVEKDLPVTLAMACEHKDLARYLYSQTPLEDLEPEQGRDGAKLLKRCIYARDLDMALELMERCPRLAFASSRGGTTPPLKALAISTDEFESENRLVFWKRWIYNHCIHISLDRAADQFRLNIQSGQQKTTGSVQADHLWHQLVSSLLNLLGFKRLYEMKLVRLQFQELLSRMCKAIPTKTSPENRDKTIAPSIFRAISKGNFEFVYHIVKAHPDLLVIKDVTNRRSIFQWAVLHRQHRIFNLIYNLKKKKFLLNGEDVSKNSILHTAGMLTEHTIDHIRGATLQMQREVQWFKEVEHICPLSRKERLNKDKLTARQLFTRNHQDLRKEGEQWMKGTATSCTVVGALIITIMFAATFTIPGGNNQDTGLPILVHDKLFTLFIVTDYMSLFSSSTSVLMFLGILTSRYAEEDFLISLPRKMILGLFALFFSIATMMIAFSTALVLMLRGKFWIIVPIIGLTGVPIILFVLMQFRLLIDMFVSTYRSSIFDRKTKAWF